MLCVAANDSCHFAVTVPHPSFSSGLETGNDRVLVQILLDASSNALKYLR